MRSGWDLAGCHGIPERRAVVSFMVSHARDKGGLGPRATVSEEGICRRDSRRGRMRVVVVSPTP